MGEFASWWKERVNYGQVKTYLKTIKEALQKKISFLLIFMQFYKLLLLLFKFYCCFYLNSLL